MGAYEQWANTKILEDNVDGAAYYPSGASRLTGINTWDRKAYDKGWEDMPQVTR